MKSSVFLGVEIAPMPIATPGSDDLVKHTVKHFISLAERWGDREPRDVLSPADALERLRACHAASAAGRTVIPTNYWEEPRKRVIIAVHDAGYYPRYVRLVRDAGAWGIDGSAWTRATAHGPARWAASVEAYFVAGDLSDRTFTVVTAYRLDIIQETRHPGSGLFKLGDLLRSRGQILQATPSIPTSKKGEGTT